MLTLRVQIFDSLKKPVFWIFFCGAFALWILIYRGEKSKECQNTTIEIQPRPGNASILPGHVQFDHGNVKKNRLKTKAAQHQKELDFYRYGSTIDRRQNVSEYCKKHLVKDEYLREANANVGRNEQLVYFDFAHSLLFCQMQKVGSSTWNTILLRIRDIKNVPHYQSEEGELGVPASRKRHFLRDTMYNLPPNFSVDAAISRLVSFVFVRHPFSRLVSAYNSKIKTVIDRSDRYFNEDIAKIQNDIITRYRKPTNVLPQPPPTPTEFIQYLIHEVDTKGPLALNPHFRPQYGLCPFCSVDFDFVGDLEYMKDDILFLGNLLSIPKQVNLRNMKENSHRDFDGFITEEEFFESVSKNLIRDLYEVVYKADFEMLSYQFPNDYIRMGKNL